MRTSRSFRARTFLFRLASCGGCLLLQGGCGGGEVDVSKPAFTSSEAAARQKEGITDAMKGGAYGKAGKAAASQPIGVPK